MRRGKFFKGLRERRGEEIELEPYVVCRYDELDEYISDIVYKALEEFGINPSGLLVILGPTYGVVSADIEGDDLFCEYEGAFRVVDIDTKERVYLGRVNAVCSGRVKGRVRGDVYDYLEERNPKISIDYVRVYIEEV